MMDENYYNSRKKAILSLVLGIVVLLILLIGSTYAYFSMRAINNFGSKNLTARAGNLGSVVLSGSSASLSMSLSKIDMAKGANDITYYASASGKTTTPTEVTIGTAIANSGHDSVSNDNYSTYHCEYVIHSTHENSDSDVDPDLFDIFVSDIYKDEISRNQLMLTINGIDYDFYDGWPEYVKGSFDLDTINSKSLTVGFKFVNKSNINQSQLSGSSIDINVEVDSFECIPTFNDLTEIYWAYEPGYLEMVSDIANNKVIDYHNLNSFYVLYYDSIHYISGPYSTQQDCESALDDYSTIENGTCNYDNDAGIYYFISYERKNKSFSTRSECEAKLSDYDVSLNASCEEVNNDIFIKEYSYYESENAERWRVVVGTSPFYGKDSCLEQLHLIRSMNLNITATCVAKDVYRLVKKVDTVNTESECKSNIASRIRNNVGYNNRYCVYNDDTGKWDIYGYYEPTFGQYYDDFDCTDYNGKCEKGLYTKLNRALYVEYETKDDCYRNFISSTAWGCHYSQTYKWYRIAPQYTFNWNSNNESNDQIYIPEGAIWPNVMYANSPVLSVNDGSYNLFIKYPDVFHSLNECEKDVFIDRDNYGFYGEVLGRLNSNGSCSLDQSNSGYYETYSNDILPIEICVNIKNGNVDNVVCIPSNSWKNINNYKTNLESTGLTCSYIAPNNLSCENANYKVDIYNSGNVFISNDSVTCKYEDYSYSCYLN